MDEGPSGEGGLSAKYQKLAHEYSKIRAQAQVLKKAVSDEQGKSNEYKDLVKDKEQVIRKLEQEVESLNFCNQQLTKRVGVLQDELEERDERSKKNKKKASANPSPVHQSVFDEELLSRIEENEKLHSQVFAAETEHRRIVEDLQRSLEEARHEISRKEDRLTETIRKHEVTIDRLTQEKAKMEVKLRNFEKDIKEIRLKEETCQEELHVVRTDLGGRLKDTAKTLQQTVQFIDTRNKVMNSLNVPVTTHNHRMKVRSFLSQLGLILPELVQDLSTLHTYMEQRIRLVLSEGCDSSVQGPLLIFAQHLHGNVSYLQPIEEAYQNFFSDVQQDGMYLLTGGSPVSGLSDGLSKYVSYLQKLLPYIVISLQARSDLGAGSKVEDLKSKIHQVASQIVSRFSKMDGYLRLLAGRGCGRLSDSCCTGYSSILKKLVKIVNELYRDFEDSKKHYSAKLVMEHQLPVVSVEAKTTDDCILSSLVNVVNGFKKICSLLEQSSSVLLSDLPYQQRGIRTATKPSFCASHINPLVPSFKDRGSKYMLLCQLKSPPESVPYQIAIENSKALKNNAESKDSLVHQLESCKAKIRKLEEEKENWMLEWQLLQAKFERRAKDMLHSNDGFHKDIAEEQLITVHLKSRIKDLISQAQVADSKAANYYAECTSIQQRLLLAEQTKNILEKELQETKQELQILKDELSSMTRNYEDQLSTMSEHLASMNEKLTEQKDEIDALRHASNSKINKKLKPK